jgi:polysaccharide deacetylase 2 family uncharacterized protein YibQ
MAAIAPEVIASAPDPVADIKPTEPDTARLPDTTEPAASEPQVPTGLGGIKGDTAPVADAVAEPPLAEPAAVPQTLGAPDIGESAVTAPEAEDADLPTTAPLALVAPLAKEPAPVAVEPPPVVDPPKAEPLLEKAPALVKPGVNAPTEPASEPDAVLAGDLPRVIVPDGKPLTDTTDKDASQDSLPRIGDMADLPEAAPALVTPLDVFARPFDNPEAKPLFSLVLLDDGAPDTDRETLAALPFPITFAIDPLAPGAAAAAAIYRKGGQEVVMQTNGVPKGAVPSDIEQSYQALDMALPEAVAVLGAAGLAEDSPQLAASVVPILAAQGRGIVTMERGLNAVDQAARREGIPRATVFRLLDASGESVPVIRRYLDRAAFRAAQEGSVVVLGSTRPDTIAAILQWTVEGRAASVALAPVSAILRLED